MLPLGLHSPQTSPLLSLFLNLTAPPSSSSPQVNGLLIPTVCGPSALTLLSPYLNLTALFATTVTALPPGQELLPNVLQELHMTAGTRGQVRQTGGGGGMGLRQDVGRPVPP